MLVLCFWKTIYAINHSFKYPKEPANACANSFNKLLQIGTAEIIKK